MSKAIAFAVHLEDVDLVGQPVEERAGQPFGAEGLGPFIEGQIAGDQRGAALLALGDHLKKQLGAGLGQGHEPELVDDQQLHGSHLLLDAQQTAFVSRLN